MKRMIQILFIRLVLFAAGAAFFGFVGYVMIGYFYYVVGLNDPYESSAGFTRSVYGMTLGGGVVTVLWFGRLGGNDDDG